MIAHGSRRAEANAELLRLADAVRQERPECDVAAAFLELAEPTIPAAVAGCVERGAQRVLLFPYFLSSGLHVTRDLEGFRRQFAIAHPGVEFRLAQPLGAHPAIAALVFELLAKADAAPVSTDGPDARQSE